MKTLWGISWPEYSHWEMWQITKAYNLIIFDDTGPTSFNSNILHIAAKSCNLALLKKVLNIEDGIDINEQDENGWTALHIASRLGSIEMIKFLIKQKGADYKITTNDEESPLYLCARNLNFKTTKYYLELGEEIPLAACYAVGTRTHKFLQELKEYFQTKLNQEPDDIKYQSILAQIHEKQKDNIRYISNSSDDITNIVVNEQNNDTTNLIGEEDV